MADERPRTRSPVPDDVSRRPSLCTMVAILVVGAFGVVMSLSVLLFHNERRTAATNSSVNSEVATIALSRSPRNPQH